MVPVQICFPKGTSRRLISIQCSGGSLASSSTMVFSGVEAFTYPQRFVTRWTWISTLINGLPQAIPRVRCAHFGPTPEKERNTSSSQGRVPLCSSKTRSAIAWICSALRSWNVHGWIRSSISSMVNLLIWAGVRARANNLREVGSDTSSYVRIEIIQATNCSNGELNPSSASSNIAAFGNDSTALLISFNARSMSNVFFILLLINYLYNKESMVKYTMRII